MQSCPKNGHVGPLTGSAGKGFPKPAAQQAPLPLLALSLELPGNLGPPSPARGSTGMPPPPSPALVTARNPDNGLLTTSKLISESMQVSDGVNSIWGVLKIRKYSLFNIFKLFSRNYSSQCWEVPCILYYSHIVHWHLGIFLNFYYNDVIVHSTKLYILL